MKTKLIIATTAIFLAPLMAFAEADDKESQGIGFGFFVILLSLNAAS